MRPSLRSSGTWTASCVRPPVRTPAAMPNMAGMPHLGSRYAKRTPDIIEPRLKQLEEKAGTKKCLRAFNMPMNSAAIETRSRKGNISSVSFFVRSSLPGISEKSGASRRTIQPESTIPRITTADTTMVKTVRTLLTSRTTSSLERFSS